jgi:hypothetical protein
MNPALAFMPKFFVIGGLVLVASGVGQWLVRARKPNETPAEMWGNRATLKMVVFVSVGVFFTLLGIGVIPFPHFSVG